MCAATDCEMTRCFEIYSTRAGRDNDRAHLSVCVPLSQAWRHRPLFRLPLPRLGIIVSNSVAAFRSVFASLLSFPSAASALRCQISLGISPEESLVA